MRHPNDLLAADEVDHSGAGLHGGGQAEELLGRLFHKVVLFDVQNF
jgi:hypothetical protein